MSEAERERERERDREGRKEIDLKRNDKGEEAKKN